jgi:tetratricopeptide (TPR) repeat protein
MKSQSSKNDRPSVPEPFSGQTIVFTGKLSSLGRREARALVARLGGTTTPEVNTRTTMLVVGDEGFGLSPTVANGNEPSNAKIEKSKKLRRAEEINAREPGCVAIVQEDEFCRLAGLQSEESLRRRYHGLRQIRERYPLIKDDRVGYLQAWGLIRPIVQTNADKYFNFADVAIIRKVHAELENGGSFRAAVRDILSARDGQLTLDFGSRRSEVRPAKLIALKRPSTSGLTEMDPEKHDSRSAQTALAARFFLEGSDLDEGSSTDQERALIAYRKALLLDPNLVPAIVNLANLHYASDSLVEAQALYERALGLDSDCFEAYFNLGNIHHDLGRFSEALAYYRDALQLQTTYADAHFYMAVTLEKLGRSKDAKPHWRAYQQLSPDGEWVELAREFSE